MRVSAACNKIEVLALYRNYKNHVLNDDLPQIFNFCSCQSNLISIEVYIFGHFIQKILIYL